MYSMYVYSLASIYRCSQAVIFSTKLRVFFSIRKGIMLEFTMWVPNIFRITLPETKHFEPKNGWLEVGRWLYIT